MKTRTRVLPKRTRDFFDRFVNEANKQVLHPCDWERFYVFIQAAYEGHTKLSQGELENLLIASGFQPGMAERLSYVYYHGRGLLKSRVVLAYKSRG